MNKLLNQRIEDFPESATLKINKISNDYISQGRTIYKFGLGQSPFPIPSHIVEEYTWSGPNWSSILTGVHFEKHNVLDNSFDNNRYFRGWSDLC